MGPQKEESSDVADLKSAFTRRLDGGRASFMARWGYESLENLHTRFASRDTTRPSGDFAGERECDCNPHDSTFECSSNAILDDDDEEEHYGLFVYLFCCTLRHHLWAQTQLYNFRFKIRW